MDFKKEYRELLETVKNARKLAGLPARNQDIAKELGYNRSYLSSLVGESGTVTAEHVKAIKLHFPEVLDNRTNGLSEDAKALKSADNSALLRILDNLSAGHREICEANNKLADRGKEFLSKIPNSASDQKNLEDAFATIKGVREFAIELYAEMKNTTPHEAAAILGKKVVDAKKKIQRKDSVSDVHKTSSE